MSERATKTAAIERVRRLTPRVVELTVRPEAPDGETFLAGQHIWIEARGESRPYSIASPPGLRRSLQFCIKPIDAGAVSAHLASLRPGERISYTGPSGAFVLREEVGDGLLFIAGGVGLAPLRSMILELLAGGRGERIDLLFGARRRADLLYPEEFAALERRNAGFSYHPCLSREDGAWAGMRGRVTTVLPRLFPGGVDRAVYVCGSPEMVRDTIAVLEALGTDADRIFTEMGSARSIAVREADR